MNTMFKVKIENYRNDYDKGYETRHFDSLESIENYLIKENERRDPTSRLSKYWRNPAGTMKDPSGKLRGWFRTSRTTNTYSLWVKTVEYGDVTVFEEGVYCSPKFYNFLNNLANKLETKPIFGDIV